MYGYVVAHSVVYLDWMVVTLSNYDRVIRNLIKYSYDYNYRGILGLNSSTKLELVKSLCNKAIRTSMINALKRDLANTYNTAQVSDAVELIIELNKL